MSLVLPSVLTIAGSDPSGGAGIQADLKTIAAFKLYGTSVITALTAQNTLGVYSVSQTSDSMLAAQLDAVLSDLLPGAVKIGMVGTKSAVEIIAEMLSWHGPFPLVLDPVMISTSGYRLIDREAAAALKKDLFPLASLITPNIPEAAALLGDKNSSLDSKEAMERAVLMLSERLQTAVLLKGGHQSGQADDVLCSEGLLTWFPGKHLDNPNTHGTGCTLSTAIACGLARGWGMEESIRHAKGYITKAIGAGLDLGKGNGPLWHGVNFLSTQKYRPPS